MTETVGIRVTHCPACGYVREGSSLGKVFGEWKVIVCPCGYNAPGVALAGEAKPSTFEGSRFIKVNENITLGCISPEARNLLDTIMEEWEKHLTEIRKHTPDYEPTPYGLAYWLVRYSGLIEPAMK